MNALFQVFSGVVNWSRVSIGRSFREEEEGGGGGGGGGVGGEEEEEEPVAQRQDVVSGTLALL